MPTTGEVHMSYFNGSFSELNAAMEAVWDQQDAAGQPRSSFTISAQGSRASV